MTKTQKNAQKQTTEQKQSRQQKSQKQSQKQSKELTVRLSELTEEQFKDVLTEAVQTAEAELKAEAEQKQTAEAQQTAEETAEEQKQTEAEQTATETAEAQQTERIERTVTDRQLAELKVVADSFVIKEQKFNIAVQSAKEIETADGEGTDNSVFIGRYGYGSNGKGELVSVWCRRKATDRKAIMYTDWISNGQKKSTEKEKHAFPCDFGLRFSQDDFKMFMDVAESKAVIDSFSTEHAEVKHNEPRFSFKTLSAVTEALAKLYNAYETAQERIKAEQTAQQTKEAEQTAETAKEA